MANGQWSMVNGQCADQPSSTINNGWLRRAWLKAATALLAAATLLKLKRPVSAAEGKTVNPKSEIRNPKSKRWGMVIDLDRCTACQACVVACQVENNVPLGSAEEAALGRTIQWIHVLHEMGSGESHSHVRYMPIPCQMCDNPPCTRVCPVYATYKNPEGLVAQIYPRCIGCRYCVNACPYTCKFFNWQQPQFPKEMQQALNPDVSVRPKGVTEKCTFCHHRLQRAREQAKAEGRELHESDYQPACVQACPAGAIFFGDLDDTHSAVSQLAHSARAFRLQEDLGTEPKVYYLNEE